eukprot:CAMPEP_0118923734 /NCGR_PEP_ID=MMETSP1169-20130426/2154_1 /TAXON_ID=36882 /ORGANISM="Pyramimonas obovata, Strain CCMP722" /LENGTH=270 /DNA_ID=CAMNT_0006864765 /DNA_START=347 /DNA_END=1156 /DNA_ORIENTATION=+
MSSPTRPRSARPASARPMSARRSPTRERPMTARSEPVYSRSSAGVSVLKVDPDRDGLLLKQYEYGLAKQRLSRLNCYEKYLPNLTKKEKALLKFEEKPKLAEVAEQGLKEPYVFISKAAQMDMDIWQQAEQRDEQMQANLDAIQDSYRNVMKKIKAVHKRWDEAATYRRKAWEEDEETRRQNHQRREHIKELQERKIKRDTFEYQKRLAEIATKKEAEKQEKLAKVREDIAQKKEEARDREEAKRAAVEQWQHDLKERWKERKGHTEGVQ